jgi:hypothetical protein
MIRDAFGRAARECSECRHVQQMQPVGRRADGTLVSVQQLLCLHPQCTRANDHAPWAASLARDVVCRGEMFERARS